MCNHVLAPCSMQSGQFRPVGNTRRTKITNIIMHKSRIYALKKNLIQKVPVKSGGDKQSLVKRYVQYVLSLCSHAHFNNYIQNMCIPQLPFLMKRKAFAFCMRYGEPSCVLSKKPQVSLGTQNKRQNWAIVSICCPRERERERVASEDTMGR